jgi:hypothetical protein
VRLQWRRKPQKGTKGTRFFVNFVPFCGLAFSSREIV